MTFLIAVMAGPGSSRCSAHPANIAAGTATIAADGSYALAVHFDLLAFALNETPQHISDTAMNALLDGPPDTLRAVLGQAANRFRQEFRSQGDAAPGSTDSVDFPSVPDVLRWRDTARPRLPVMLTVTVHGHLPRNARTASFGFPSILGTVVLSTEAPYQEPVSEPLEGGGMSTPVPVPSAAEIAQRKAEMLGPRNTTSAPAGTPARNAAPAKAVQPVVAAAVKGPMGPLPIYGPPAPADLKHPAAAPAATAPVATTEAPTAAPSPRLRRFEIPWTVTFGRYVRMGFTHILPEGLDHILFVLGLFLLSTQMKALLKQITAFTVAHSLTLALAMYGIVRLPSSIVEPVIAASIAFVAIENLMTTDLKPWRPFVVFAFGLVHGMGFASALRELGLQRHDFLRALVGFNIGVECGQLTVVLGALLLVGWARKHERYRKFVVVPGSLAIAAVALFWVVQRILQGGA